MTLDQVIKQKRKELKKLIKKIPKGYRYPLLTSCKICLNHGLNNDNKRYNLFLSATPIYQKETCKAAYDIGIQFGPLEKGYVKERLSDKWLTKMINKYR